MSTEYIAIGAILAAIITAAVSLAGLIISKESKVSEFRHQWIQELRICMSELIGHVISLSGKRQSLGENEVESKELISSLDDFKAAFTKMSEIEMRLNPDEHTELIRLVHNVSAKLTDSKNFLLVPSAVGKLLSLLVKETQSVVKTEWERVKTGEKAFIYLKRILGIGTTLVIIVALVLLYVIQTK